ncbi:hypothetical protein Acid345_4364 [Candidatus Koribacter versatilis Ellin345]|uniref:TonB C-terminal domain-containing protein n=1 Tax=Koribacter versatilis (strain Ellin345) TaxID=204669 RepID=Q1IID6_KORVE|nr:energy transducer TonB [Candidatus Koribacter versatilis]ABF43364.1 hypothetical protein Acid345_4364 [Candidatus Koribacter versatilis Ellin345]
MRLAFILVLCTSALFAQSKPPDNPWCKHLPPSDVRILQPYAQSFLTKRVELQCTGACASALRMQGQVAVDIVVNRDGEPISICGLSGPPPLITAAIDAVRQWRFRPYLLNGEPHPFVTTFALSTTALSTTAPNPQSTPLKESCTTIKELRRALRIRTSEVVARDLLIKRIDPVCTGSCESRHDTIVLRVTINERGEPTSLCVFSGTGPLINPSIEAVRQWRFKPYLLNGEPEPIESLITLTYPTEHK